MRSTLRIALVSMLASLLFWGASQTSIVTEATDYYLELFSWHNEASAIVDDVRSVELQRRREGSSRSIQREDLSPESRNALLGVMARYLTLVEQHIVDENMVRRLLTRVSSTRSQQELVLAKMLQVSERRNTAVYDMLVKLYEDDGIAPGDVDMLYFRIEVLNEISLLYQYIRDLY